VTRNGSNLKASQQTEVMAMLRTRRAAQVLAAAIVTWVLVTAFLVAWLLSFVLPDPSSHLAQDAAFFGTLVVAPLVVLALVGLVVLNALRTDDPHAPGWGLAWGLLQSLAALLMSFRFLSLALTVVTEGRRIAWDAGDSAIVFLMPGGAADYTHWTDWASVLLLGVSIVAVVAAEILALTPGRGPAGMTRPA
jgi:hypothetical protein